MKRILIPALAAISVLAVTVRPSFALVVGDTDLLTAFSPGGQYEGLNPNYVYATKGGTSVSIGYFTLLTADHYYINTVADDDDGYNTFNINGDTWAVASTQQLAPDSGQTVSPDLRILNMVNLTNPYRPLPGHYELYTPQGTWPIAQKQLVLIGSGDSGEDHTSYYTNTEDTRAMRWGTNTISGWTRRTFTDYTGADHSTYCMDLSYYKWPSMPNEAGLGDHDSGSAFLTNDDGVWKLAGMGLYRYEAAGSGTRYRDFAGASIPFYADQLHAILADDLLPGDADLDGLVDASDYIRVKTNFGMSAASWTDGDFDGDGRVGYEDLMAVTTNLGYESDPHPYYNIPSGGASSEGSSGVPEPTTAVLLAIGAAILPLRRGQRR